jgi:hypothetical protein
MLDPALSTHKVRKRHDSTAGRLCFLSFTCKGDHNKNKPRRLCFCDRQCKKNGKTFILDTVQRQRNHHHHHNNHSDDDDNNHRIGERFYNMLFTSSKNSAIFYQVILLVLVVVKEILPTITAVIAFLLYMFFSGVAQTFVGDEMACEDDSEDDYDDKDSEPMYLLAFVGALLTAGIVTPLNTPSPIATLDVMQNSPTVLSVFSLGMAAASIHIHQYFSPMSRENMKGNNNKPYEGDLSLSDVIENDRKLMEMWYENFRRTFKINDTCGEDQK